MAGNANSEEPTGNNPTEGPVGNNLTEEPTENNPTEEPVDDAKDINILLIGQTGVGKSTLINAIVNYFNFDTFESAELNGLNVLIPTSFVISNEDYDEIRVELGNKDKNEYDEVGASATQSVKTYVFPIDQGRIRLRMIDSPGLGDTRGIQQDDENCENILGYISQLKELHAICFVMDPKSTRITVLFEYCVKQILSRLEKSASQNIIFIMTNARGTNYGPGSTCPCLKKVIDKVAANQPFVKIPFKKNIFYLDNEAFRGLAALENKVTYLESTREQLVKSWEHSYRECWKMITYIVGNSSEEALVPHQMENTISVNQARRLIVELSKPLADIAQLITDNLYALKRHQESLGAANMTLKELNKKLYMPVIKLEVTSLTQPVTVCTSPQCAEVYKVGDVSKWHYRQRCHDPCYLQGVPKEIIGDPALEYCAAMMRGTNKCTQCKCDYKIHMHIYYITKTVEDKVVDTNIQANIKNKEKALDEATKLIDEIEHRRKELENEHDIIIQNTAKFAHFLQNHAISPINDAYKAYIKFLIEREKGCGKGADMILIKNLERLMLRYKQIKAVFDKSIKMETGESPVTVQDVMDSISELFQLKHNGKKIRELFDTQRNCRTQEYKNCEYVHPKVTGKSRSFWRWGIRN